MPEGPDLERSFQSPRSLSLARGAPHPRNAQPRNAVTTIPAERPTLESQDDVALAGRLRAARDAIVGELRQIIVGQDDVIEQALVALFSGGNCLIVGVPGLA